MRAADGSLLDRALVLRFEAATSATGQDLVELHCHGGVAVVRAVKAALLVDRRARPAVAGEFTRRALENGRIDLAQAQGLADLLAAETETQRRYAIQASEGHVSRAIRGWMDRLLGIAAEIEASIDYGEEGDVIAEAASLATIDERRGRIVEEMRVVLAAPPVERWRDGIRVVLAGPPNAGKSTLLNLLVGRDAAIVSDVAGTTRDRIEVPVQRDGVAYLLTDTAGLRPDSDDQVERIGMERARAALEAADLVLWLGDDRPAMPALWLHARADLPTRSIVPPTADLAVSAADPTSIEALWQLIARRTSTSDVPLVPLHAVERARCAVAVQLLETGEPDVILLAEAVRAAVGELAAILGDHPGELMLDRLFARFCIGK